MKTKVFWALMALWTKQSILRKLSRKLTPLPQRHNGAEWNRISPGRPHSRQPAFITRWTIQWHPEPDKLSKKYFDNLSKKYFHEAVGEAQTQSPRMIAAGLDSELSLVIFWSWPGDRRGAAQCPGSQGPARHRPGLCPAPARLTRNPGQAPSALVL